MKFPARVFHLATTMDHRITLEFVEKEPTHRDTARKTILAKWPHLDEKNTTIWLRDIHEPDSKQWNNWFQDSKLDFHFKDKAFFNKVFVGVSELEYVQIPRHYLRGEDGDVKPIIIGVFSGKEQHVMVWGKLGLDKIVQYLDKWQADRQCPSISYKSCRAIRTPDERAESTGKTPRQIAWEEWQHRKSEEVFWAWVKCPKDMERREKQTDLIILEAQERADVERKAELKQLRESAERMHGPQPDILPLKVVKNVHECDEYAFLLAKTKKMKLTRKQFLSAVVNCGCVEFDCVHAKQIVYE